MTGRLAHATNQVEIRVVGMSRSGNHAIIDWILAQASGSHCFLNCAEPRTNPFVSHRPLSEDQPGYRTNIEGFDLVAEAGGELSRKDLLIHSYEDTFLGAFARPEVDARHDDHVGRSRRRLDVVILRDPFNLFASRLACGFGTTSPAVAARIWCQHAREFLGEGKNLANELVGVSFNRWATERGYRRATARALGLAFDDAAARRVPACAGGSSFDGTRFDGCAEQMPVLARWERFEGRPNYEACLIEPVRELSRRIFGTVVEEQPRERQLAA